MYERGRVNLSSGFGAMGDIGMAPTPAYQQAPETACRESEVPGEMNRLGRAIDEMGLVVEQLTARLVPVRRSVGNTIGKGEPMPPEPVLCDLASMIRNQRQGIERHIAMLRAALNELEI